MPTATSTYFQSVRWTSGVLLIWSVVLLCLGIPALVQGYGFLSGLTLSVYLALWGVQVGLSVLALGAAIYEWRQLHTEPDWQAPMQALWTQGMNTAHATVILFLGLLFQTHFGGNTPDPSSDVVSRVELVWLVVCALALDCDVRITQRCGDLMIVVALSLDNEEALPAPPAPVVPPPLPPPVLPPLALPPPNLTLPPPQIALPNAVKTFTPMPAPTTVMPPFTYQMVAVPAPPPPTKGPHRLRKRHKQKTFTVPTLTETEEGEGVV